MLFTLKQYSMPLFGLLLPLITACSSSTVSEGRIVPSVSEAKILREQVNLGPSFKAHVTSIRFFEGDRSKLAFSKERVYQTRFAQAKTRTVYTEIHLDHAGPGAKVYFPITLYFRQNGRTLRIEEFESRLAPDWTSSDHLVSAGHFEPGKWHVGNYEVDVYIHAEKVATGYFEIY
ncbi:MAG TPA: hypothetical protein VE616_10235 [Candidatus Udaeobacter sp.]|nr:hypothetical protein [Candidatus Udaeobacter sp.]